MASIFNKESSNQLFIIDFLINPIPNVEIYLRNGNGSDETQEHLQLCGGTSFERRGLDLSDKRGLLDFWRRMKMKLAAVT